MKILVTTDGPDLQDAMDQRFGRAAGFFLFDTEAGTGRYLPNDSLDAQGGAGVASAQLAIEMGADTIVTGHLGPNAFRVLSHEGLRLLQGIPGTVQDNIDACLAGHLTPISGSGPAHRGMGRGRA